MKYEAMSLTGNKCLNPPPHVLTYAFYIQMYLVAVEDKGKVFTKFSALKVVVWRKSCTIPESLLHSSGAPIQGQWGGGVFQYFKSLWMCPQKDPVFKKKLPLRMGFCRP